MKKVIGIFCLICLVFTSFSFAAYPAELENAELEANNLEAVEWTPIQPRTMSDDIMLINEEIEQTPIEPRDTTGEVTIQTVPKNEEESIIYDDLFKMEDEVVINNIVDGNVYIMAQNVKIENATIYGTVYIMAENIEVVNSEINGTLYSMSSKLSFSGMANDLYIMAQDVKLDEHTYIWRTARILAENIDFNGTVLRDFYASVANLTVGDEAVVDGKMKYSSETEGEISENASIADVEFVKNEVEEAKIATKELAKSAIIFGYVSNIISVIFKTLIVSLIIVFLVDKFNKLKRTENVVTDLLVAMCKGAGVLVVVPIIVIILICTVIGIALGITLIAIYSIMLYIAISVIALDIAYRILSKKGEVKKSTLILITILISIAIWAIGLVPVVGGKIKFLVILMGLGILFDLIFQRNKKEVKNEN